MDIANMNIIVLWASAAVILGVVGFLVGRSAGRSAGRRDGLRDGRAEAEVRLRSVAESIELGDLPERGPEHSAEAAVATALERGWAPRGAERQSAMLDAVTRMSNYLDSQIRAVLGKASSDSSPDALRDMITRALGNLADLKSFLRQPGEGGEIHDLIPVVQQVAREFAVDQGTRLRLQRGAAAVRATIQPKGLMDALYLVFHNAARFGDAPVIDVLVSADDGRARIAVRDRGEGFSPEATARAFDPFYSTASDGLGLGLPHARRLVEAMGGEIKLDNLAEGGGEVEISFPLA